ncbi:MAG: hypothetical protein ACODAD_01220 [Planctomycetota bacterium]
MKKALYTLACTLASLALTQAQAGELDALETQFHELPMEARRLTGPLFWLHGDANETRQRLESYLEKVAEGGNGCFTAESRPHSDWLGPRWYEDLDICLQKAKQLDLQMWIFDERWWPSQSIGGTVLARGDSASSARSKHSQDRTLRAKVGEDGYCCRRTGRELTTVAKEQYRRSHIHTLN